MNSNNYWLPIEEKGIVVDLGTGDGRFVYQSALKNPQRLYIGIDAATGPLQKISEKIHRKPAKGGVKNALFLQAAVESLPDELNGIADQVHVHFPWGSLLKCVATGDETILKNIHRICAPAAVLEVIVGNDRERDINELLRLGIEPLTKDAIASTLIERYKRSGFTIKEFGEFTTANWPPICTSWAQRLRQNESRSLVYLIAEAT